MRVGNLCMKASTDTQTEDPNFLLIVHQNPGGGCLLNWGVVLAEWVKDIQDFGVFHGASLMLDTAWNNEAVSAARIKRYTASGKLKVSLNHIDHLVIWMAVSCSDPALLHLMADQHQVWVEGQHLT
jgi:hypothetical protein